MIAPALRNCPKCGHARAPDSPAPAWQCPACGIAYHKYQAYLEKTRKAFVPPRSGDPVPSPLVDGSILSLVGANLLTIFTAWHEGWGAAFLMQIYWAQSVIIGMSYFARMLSLERFSTQGLKINDRRVEPTDATRRQVAGFFAVHYGFFHLGYLAFLADMPIGKSPLNATMTMQNALLDPWVLPCVAAFALNHVFSYRYNRELDRQGTPNIGTMMFTPYLRIIPMHLTIIFGGQYVQSEAALLLFGILKTFADIGMHVAEHRVLQRNPSQPD